MIISTYPRQRLEVLRVPFEIHLDHLGHLHVHLGHQHLRDHVQLQILVL